MTLYVRIGLWLISPILDAYHKQRYGNPTLVGAVATSTRAQQEEVKRDIRGRFAKKPELHR